MPPDYSQQPSPDFPPGQAPQVQQPASYDFILNPQQSTKPSIIPGQSSVLMRIVFVVVGFFVLLIVFIIIKGLIFKGPDLNGYVTIAQDQQSIITLVTNASGANQLVNLPTVDQNLAATAQLTITSSQSQVLTYLAQHADAVKSTTLLARGSTSIASQLSNAKAAGDYSSVFQSLLTNQLNTYINDIDKTIPGSGKVGKTMLRKLYAQAELMVTQLS